MPKAEARVAAIYRDGQSIEPDGDTIILSGDEVFFVAATQDIRTVMREMQKLEDPVKRVVIAGGGNIGFRLAQTLEDGEPGQDHRARIEARPQHLRAVAQHDRAGRRRRRRRTAGRGKHRQRRRLLRAHEFRGSEHPVGDAGEAPRRASRDGVDQSTRVRRPDADRLDRCGHFAADGDDRLVARLRAARRRRAGAFVASRLGRSHGNRGARRARRQGRRAAAREHQAARRREDRDDRARRPGDHGAPRHA